MALVSVLEELLIHSSEELSRFSVTQVFGINEELTKTFLLRLWSACWIVQYFFVAMRVVLSFCSGMNKKMDSKLYEWTIIHKHYQLWNYGRPFDVPGWHGQKLDNNTQVDHHALSVNIPRTYRERPTPNSVASTSGCGYIRSSGVGLLKPRWSHTPSCPLIIYIHGQNMRSNCGGSATSYCNWKLR